MASSSGASSASANCGIRTSGSEEDQEVERKRRRMQSNRESARRSRLRKQKRLDDLTEQVNRLKSHNNQIVANTNVAGNLCISLEAENSILRAQLTELTQRLQSLNDIVIFINSTTVFKTTLEIGEDCYLNGIGEDCYLNGFEDEDYH